VTQVGYPYAPDRRGRTADRDEARHVRDLIEQTLFTAPGERVNRPSFGTPLSQLLFEPNSDDLTTVVQTTVQASLRQSLGGLIEVEQVEVESLDSQLRVTVVYVHRRLGRRESALFVRES
jgi:phage baseplate assembly protein W